MSVLHELLDDPARFGRWLRDKADAGEDVGGTNDAGDCPLANFIREKTGAYRISVLSEGEIYLFGLSFSHKLLTIEHMNTFESPPWVSQTIAALDGLAEDGDQFVYIDPRAAYETLRNVVSFVDDGEIGAL